MKVPIVRIGKSRGIRLPKPVIEPCGFDEEVELEVQNKTLVIWSSKRPREGWAAEFQKMGEAGDDQLLQ